MISSMTRSGAGKRNSVKGSGPFARAPRWFARQWPAEGARRRVSWPSSSVFGGEDDRGEGGCAAWAGGLARAGRELGQGGPGRKRREEVGSG
jgi:hypothetical protein